MKVLFAGTPDFAVEPLIALIQAQHQIVGVFTQPDRKAGRGKKLTPSPVKLAAIEHDLPIFQPANLSDQAELIKELAADVMVVVAYGVLLPQAVLDIPPLGCLNIHASILPRWRGAAPIQRAIEAGDAQTGVSIMRMELGLDTGPVYTVLTTDIGATDTSQSLHNKLAKLGAQGICDTLSQLDQNPSLPAQTQPNKYAIYAKKLNKAEATVDWTRSAQEIDQQVRAFNPWPICQTYHNQTRIRIWQASVLKPDISAAQTSNHKPGDVIDVSSDGVDVQTGDGVLRLERCQRDGSKPMPIVEFCNGYPLEVGDCLYLLQADN